MSCNFILFNLYVPKVIQKYLQQKHNLKLTRLQKYSVTLLHGYQQWEWPSVTCQFCVHMHAALNRNEGLKQDLSIIFVKCNWQFSNFLYAIWYLAWLILPYSSGLAVSSLYTTHSPLSLIHFLPLVWRQWFSSGTLTCSRQQGEWCNSRKVCEFIIYNIRW